MGNLEHIFELLNVTIHKSCGNRTNSYFVIKYKHLCKSFYLKNVRFT